MDLTGHKQSNCAEEPNVVETCDNWKISISTKQENLLCSFILYLFVQPIAKMHWPQMCVNYIASLVKYFQQSIIQIIN